MRRIVIGLVALAVLVAASACGSAGAAPDSLLNKDSVVIGVKSDQPGLGIEAKNGKFEGFDVDVATYVAKQLGFSNDQITFKDTPSSVRESSIQGGKVDFVVASYSITPERETEVAFAGPYYVAHQDILVQADDKSVKNVRDLAGKRLCSVTGSNSANRVVEEKSIAAERVNSESYSDCIAKLKSGDVDAVSTDDLILAGFAATAPGELKIVNASFTDERYGIGLAKPDVDACEQMNTAITKMYQDGTAKKLLDKWFGKTTLRPTTSVPQFEGCT